MDRDDGISRRKEQHLDNALNANVTGATPPGWDDVHLVPRALPEVSLGNVDVSVDLLGHPLRAPFVIASMTGGHPAAEKINATLGAAAERLGLAVGVGSQRAALVDPALAHTYAAVRAEAPTAMVLGNLGVCQLIEQDGAKPVDATDIRTIVDMVGAQALCLHLNVAEEIVQTEGDRTTTGLLAALKEAVGVSPVPVIAKETGSGLSNESARLLAGAGVHALDVGGSGGTSFVRIEGLRAADAGDRRGVRLGTTFASWGLPTAVSVLEARNAGLPVIATGGVRSGLDAAKALALGATVVGIGRVAIVAAQKGLDALIEELELMIEELRCAMVLTGMADLAGLRSTPAVLTGPTHQWALQRGLLDDRR